MPPAPAWQTARVQAIHAQDEVQTYSGNQGQVEAYDFTGLHLWIEQSDDQSAAVQGDRARRQASRLRASAGIKQQQRLLTKEKTNVAHHMPWSFLISVIRRVSSRKKIPT